MIALADLKLAVDAHPLDAGRRGAYADSLDDAGEPAAAALQRVLAWPDDDGRRLEYADAVGGDRGEFVRAQIASATYTDCPVRLADLKGGRPIPLRCGACEYCVNRRRSEELSHRFPILPPVVPAYGFCLDPSPLDGAMPDTGGVCVAVRRGFVERVTCPAADWLAHGDAILAAHPVTAVTLTDATAFGPRGEFGGIGEWGGSEFFFATEDGIRDYLAARWPRVREWTLPAAELRRTNGVFRAVAGEELRANDLVSFDTAGRVVRWQPGRDGAGPSGQVLELDPAGGHATVYVPPGRDYPVTPTG